MGESAAGSANRPTVGIIGRFHLRIALRGWRSILGLGSLSAVLALTPACFAQNSPAQAPPPSTQSVDPAAKQLLAADGLLQRGLFEPAADAFEQFLTDYPQNDQANNARYGLAICRYRLNQYAKAIDPLKAVVADATFEPRDEALIMLGYCELSERQYDSAVSHLSELVDKYPQSKQAEAAQAYRIQALYLNGEAKDSAAAAQAFLDAHPQSSQRPTALYFLALSQKALGQNEQTLQTLDRLAGDFPNSDYQLDATLLRGQALEAEGKLDAAIEQYRKMLAAAPDARKSDAHYSLGLALSKAGQLDEAAGELTAVAPDSPYATSAHLQLGLTDLSRGRTAEARAAFSTAGDSPDAQFGIAQCDIADKKFDVAFAALDRLSKQSPAPANIAEIALYRAICLMEMSKTQEAADAFDALAARFPDSPQLPQALYRAAFCLQQLGKYDASHDRCQSVAKIPASDVTRPTAELDAENLFQLGHYVEAQAAFDALVAVGGEEERQLLFRMRGGQCAAYRGKYPDAVARLKPLADDPRVAQSPTLRQALFQLGDAELQAEDNADAAAMLKRYLSVADGDQREAQFKLAIAELRAGETADATAQLESLAVEPADSPWVQRGMLELAQLRYRSGSADAASPLLDKLLAAHPAAELTAQALYLRGWLAFDAKHFSDAADIWKQVRVSYADQPVAIDAAFEEGVALQQAGQADPAVAALQSFAAAHPTAPNAPKAQQLAASILAQQGKTAQAAAILAKLAQNPAVGDDVLYDLAWAQRNAKQPADAEETYRRLITQRPDSKLAPAARAELGELLYADGNYSQAAAMLWPLVSSGTGDKKVLAAAGYRLAWCYQKQNDFDKAAAAFRDFATRWPSDELAPSALLQAALADADAGRDADAEKELASMLKQFPQHKDAPIAMLKLAEVQAAEDDFDASLKTARDFITTYPADPLVYRAEFSIGWAMENQKHFDEARAAYKKVIAATNGETAARAQFQIGETFLAEQKYQQAAPAFLAVEDVYAYPKWSARALFEAGRTFEQLNQPAQAKIQYTQLVTKYKDAPEAQLAQSRLKTVSGS